MKWLLKSSLIFIITAVCLLGLAFPVFADDYDYRLNDVMAGNVPDIAAVVNGSGEGYYGDSLRVTFSNYSGRNHRVLVPIGLRLVPDNTSVQTMYTAGGEVFDVPPGESSFIFKGFCGEQHDAGPGSYDVFRPGGFAEGDLMRTLQEINRQETFDSNAQAAVWHRTDDNDISGNEIAMNLTGTSAVSPGKAAAAGGVTAGVAIAATLLMNLLNGNGGGSITGPTTDYDTSGPDDFIDEDYEPVYPPDDEFREETPPPDWNRFEDTDVYQQPPENVPEHLRPPIEIAEIPPPEDPGEGVMIACSDDNPLKWLWNKFLEGRDMKVAVPDKLPPHVVDPETSDESVWDLLKRKLWDETPGRYDTPEDTAAKDEANRHAGQTLRRNAPFGSASELNKAMSDPVNYSQTGDGDSKDFIRQLKREQHEKGASSGIAWTRRMHNLKSLANSQSGPNGVARDLSGRADFIRDFAEPDVKDWVHDKIPVYQYDNDGHQAMQDFYDKHSRLPDENNTADHDEFMKLYRRLKGK